MSRRVILLHGFNVRDSGVRTIQKLRPYLTRSGFNDVNAPSYGFVHLFGAAFFNDNFAALLAGMSEPHDVLVAHSNGCALAYRAIHHESSQFEHLVFINPALRPCVPIPSKVKSLDVWHSPSDRAVRAARFTSWFTFWGNMGAVGYRGPKDRRVQNFNKQENFPVSSKGHSDVFESPALEFFAPRIVQRIKENTESKS